MMHAKRMAALLAAVLLVMPLLAGCGKTVGETIDDATITTRVKTAFVNDPVVGALRIDVDTQVRHAVLRYRNGIGNFERSKSWLRSL